jgi:hypothetical protein
VSPGVDRQAAARHEEECQGYETAQEGEPARKDSVVRRPKAK